MNPSTIILYRDRKGGYRWTEKAGNGEPVARSAQGKGYTRAGNRNKGLMAAARGLGLYLTRWAMPSRGRTVRLKVIGTTIRQGQELLAVAVAFPNERIKTLLIIRNDDDK